MWIEAVLTNEDVLHVLRQFSPLEIRLGDSGTLQLASPSKVSLIPQNGIGVVCDATLHYPVLGLDVPVHMHGLTVLIHPSVQSRPDGPGENLVFALQLDRTGMAILPALIDEGVSKLINEELVKKHVQLSWGFYQTLSHVFALPAALASAASLELKVTGGAVKITEKALGLAVCFETAVQRRAARS